MIDSGVICLEKRNLKVNSTENNDEKKEKNSYTFLLPANDYINDIKVEEKNKKEKEVSKDKQ